MSKKIIYLLSLLMALSLVFSSCKKNGITDALGGLKPPADTSQGQEDAGDDGLFEEYDKIPNGEIANTGVFVTTDGNYYRNPVVVARPNGTIFVFAEKRWKSDGSGNDVGIDGINTTDVIYRVSVNGGYKFGTQEHTVGAKASGPDTSHGAPVVFVKDKTIVVVATSGSGIGRTTQATVAKKPSKIEYIKGTIKDDNNGAITWDTSWAEVRIGGQSIVDMVKTTPAGGNQGKNFNQVATPPSRGFVASDGTMYLDVVLAYQGDENPHSSVYELMGRMTISASISNPAAWTKVEDPVAYTTSSDNAKLGPWKETKLISDGSTSYKHLVVPSPWAEPTSLRPWVLGTGVNKQATINRTSIPASEGSVGYFITNKWFGSQKYEISGTEGQGNTSISAGSTGSSPKTMGVLVHVQQTAKNLYLYRVDESLTMQGKGWKLDDVGKSSSVDMMADGTIVVAAEKGGAEKNYFIRLLRYSQKYIEAQTTK